MSHVELSTQLERIRRMHLAKRARKTWHRISRETRMPDVAPVARNIAISLRRRVRRLLRQIRNNL